MWKNPLPARGENFLLEIVHVEYCIYKENPDYFSLFQIVILLGPKKTNKLHNMQNVCHKKLFISDIFTFHLIVE
jgi:hypothetical protein